MINFIPLQTQHLLLLHDWLNKTHSQKFYQLEPISLQQVTDKYQNRITHREPVICHIVCKDNVPFGYIQSYKINDYPDYAREIQESSGISLDLFIGDPMYLHRRLGSQMLKSYLNKIVFNNYPNENKCYICHETDNTSAIKCSIAAGFTYVRDVVEDNEVCQLFVYDKF